MPPRPAETPSSASNRSADEAAAASGAPALPSGLTDAEAAKRLATVGPNALPEPREHLLRRLLGKLTGPVAYLLEAAAILEVAAGHTTEAIIIVALLVFNGVLSFQQEGRARDALELLRSRLAIQARVRRGGVWRTVDATTLVPDDVVHVRVGDIAPADLRIVEGELSVDASVLTGESRPAHLGPGSTCYAGSVIARGEATGIVTATGAATYFGHTAQLVSTATTQTHLEETILRIVRILLALDGVLVVAIVADGIVRHLPPGELLPFVLILLVAAVPVALPATFTLATSVGALELAHDGVLVTRLSAIEEAAAMDILCSDKTGTITENRLRVVDVRALAGHDASEVLDLAAAASDEATQDPIDLAILAAASTESGKPAPFQRTSFVPFDPATKRSEARVVADGHPLRIVKGAPRVIADLAGVDPSTFGDQLSDLAASGARVLAVARGADALELVGLVALGDPIRADSPELVAHLSELGVRVVMVTGDSAETALAVGRAVGIGERLGSTEELRARSSGPVDFDLVAGVLPEDKLLLVERAQRNGHIVGMTGDGVNDAPALKRAEVGIAVANATDVAKRAASLVLTTAGLGGIVSAIETGRRVYQRMLTYTLNKIAKTIQVSLFLGLGVLLTGTFVTTPRLVLLLLFANDVVTMSLATDRVGFSTRPDRWRIRELSVTSLVVAVPWLLVAFATFLVARNVAHLDLARTQTLVFIMLVATGQATVYIVRERRHLWASMPSPWMLLATGLDLLVVSLLAWRGVLMAPVALGDVGLVLGAVAVATVLLDLIKAPLLARIRADAPERTGTDQAAATRIASSGPGSPA